jgi:hypothetical protein
MSECGTRSSYVGGCRCGACREANAEYHQQWRGAGRSVLCVVCGRSFGGDLGLSTHIAKSHPSVPRRSYPTHGISAYRAGCRCDACRAANAAQQRAFYARHRSRAS